MPLALTRRRLVAGTAALALGAGLPRRARAQIPVTDAGVISHQLVQIWNQIESLGHELAELNNWGLSLMNQAQQLVNEARMIATLPLSMINQVRSYLSQGSGVISAALALGQQVVSLQQVFSQQYPAVFDNLSWQTLTRQSAGWTANTRQALQATIQIQDDASHLIDRTTGQIQTALDTSAAAQGVTSAVQAQTQLLAGLATQLATLTTLTNTQAQLQNTVLAQAEAERARARAINQQLEDDLRGPHHTGAGIDLDALLR